MTDQPPDIAAQIAALGLTEAQRIGCEAIAAIKSTICDYVIDGLSCLDGARLFEIVHCIGMVPDADTAEMIAEGVITKEQAQDTLMFERDRMLKQAEAIGNHLMSLYRIQPST